MIDLQLYRVRIGSYCAKSPGGKTVSQPGNVSDPSEVHNLLFMYSLKYSGLYPFVHYYLILYIIFILHIIFYIFAMSTQIEFYNSLNNHFPITVNHLKFWHNDLLTTTIRLYFAIISSIICRRCKIYENLGNFFFYYKNILLITHKRKLIICAWQKLLKLIMTYIYKLLYMATLIIINIRNFIYSPKTVFPLQDISSKLASGYSHIINKVNELAYCIFIWLSIINFILILISNPSISNPGPRGAGCSSVDSVHVVYQNVQGLIPFSKLNCPNPSLNITKLLELQSYVYMNKPEIVVLNETWLKPSINDNEILSPDSYNIFRLDRSGKTHPPDPTDPKKFRKHGGGVLIATKADLNLTIKRINIKCSAEILSIQITFPNGQKIIVCTLYRVGTLGMENFIKIEAYLQSICKRRGISNFVLLGDVNMNKTKWLTLETQCNTEQAFLDLFCELGLTQLIRGPTHNKGGTLDIVLTRSESNITDIKILDYDEICKSDHRPIKFNIKGKVNRSKAPKRQIYNFKKADWVKLNEDLSNTNWNEVIHNTSNMNLNWNKFKHTLFEHVNRHIPRIKIKSEFQPPWFDSETYELCREKERLRSHFKATKSDESYMKFSDCRRKFKLLVKQKMKDNFTDVDDPDSINKSFGRMLNHPR